MQITSERNMKPQKLIEINDGINVSIKVKQKKNYRFLIYIYIFIRPIYFIYNFYNLFHFLIKG